MRFVSPVLVALSLSATAQAAPDFTREILPLLEDHCFDCHTDTEKPKGGVNLERFTTEEAVMADRQIWASVFEKIESHQMPPPKRESLPATAERKKLLEWIADVAARPDAQLGARDPGKPVLRRLTRLEYNNTARDLLGLEMDLFLFPERWLFRDKAYFQPETGSMGDEVRVQMIEYGGKLPVLLPNSGLPGDNRAEHGFRNRGDTMNFSPLLLEKYVALAGEIANHPELPRRSPFFAAVLGIDHATLPPLVKPGRRESEPAKEALPVTAAARFAPGIASLPANAANGEALAAFQAELERASAEGRGGVFDVPAALANQTIAGKGGLIRSQFGGGKALTINPNADLWLVGFATATPASAPALIANKAKGEKVFELTFDIRDGDEDEEVTKIAVCVLGRRGQSGEARLVAKLSDGTESATSVQIAEGAAGTTWASFAALPGEHIRSLLVDGSKFSGDFVLLDDLAFITSGQPRAQIPVAPIAAPRPAPAAAKALTPAPVENNFRALAARPARARLTAFMERAFRRAVTPEELDRYFAVFSSAKADGKSEQDAMRSAAQAVLASPAFLYLAETVDPKTAKVRALEDFELASRLSYFLWASAPDDALLAKARAGQLRDPAVLEAEARRMLRSPKARELSESFATQWLRLDGLYTAKPDKQLFKLFYAGPQGKGTLHSAMLTEALLLFETVLVEDRSILDFLDPGYTWLNPRMAAHYGLSVHGQAKPGDNLVVAAASPADQPNRELKSDGKDANARWRRVTLPDKTRGGYLTMAGPLTVTSLPFRTSPVKRGAWMLETIFNRPPTEPKEAFAIANDTKEAAKNQSIREKFEAHRNEAACYSCHIRLDPPGFALERFDPVGAWRDRDGGQPVDARGEWQGQAFDGPAAYKELLSKNPREFTRGFIEQLLSYALGRKLEVYDLPAISEIQRAAAADGNRFSRVVVEIVKSYPFRHARNVPAQPTAAQ